MARSLWYFLFYSFLGFLAEVAFARAVGAEKRDRKCFLALPLCPVYGLAMGLAAWLVPEEWSFPAAAVAGAVICTGTEYLVHWLYESAFSVRFWDYAGERGNLHGRVCLRFTAAWGVLSALGLKLCQPRLALLAAAVPTPVTAWAWALLTADAALSAGVLLRFHDTELLALPALRRQLRASSQSSTSR